MKKWLILIVLVWAMIGQARVRPIGSRMWDFTRENIEQQADFILQQTEVPITITTPGLYRLAESLSSIGAGQSVITVNTSNVVIDLNGKTITGDTAAVTVSGQSNVIIKNGFVVGVPYSTGGIVINAGSVGITVDSVELSNFSVEGAGIIATSATGIAIRNCYITAGLADGILFIGCNDIAVENTDCYNNGLCGIEFVQSHDGFVRSCMLGKNSTSGMRMTLSYNIVVEDCVAYDNSTIGFELLQSTTNVLSACKAIGNGGITGTSGIIESGFYSSNGIGNIFESCIANGTTTTATNAASQVAGFALLGTEQCSKIINCESGNTTSPSGGSAIPYGILIGSSVDNLATVTQTPFNTAGQLINTSAWHPNSQLFALASASTNNIRLYEYNRVLSQLVLDFSVTPVSVGISQIVWSPDGNYLASAGDASASQVQVFSLDRINKTLTVLPGCNQSIGAPNSANSIAWSGDEQFIAVATTAPAIIIYRFNSSSLSLQQVTNFTTPSAVNSLAWSFDGNYLATGDSAGNVDVYLFNKSSGSNTLTLVATQSHGAIVDSVAWTSGGNYLAIGGNSSGGITLRVYAFNKTTQALSLASSLNTGDPIGSVLWSPNNLYIAASGSIIHVYLFNRTTNQIALVGNASAPAGVSQSWSPDGKYLINSGNICFIINALKFPSTNLIQSNKVYCNVGNQYPGGVGISGSSIQNLIIKNTSYKNTFNYEFVTNSYFNGLDGAPTLIQNVSIPPYDEP